ncbi:unnamed protein product [Microthlaspi erraticum]|uniref:F-box domain-containing protein n=1 Tax=Microthlaspi erraticum TaxID=1685480 RepID=A0A6D2HR90_9BRAS|nr:unnamed protein product [Microthlaspi erraticum]
MLSKKEEEPPPTPTPNQWSLLMSLPNDLLLNCVARLSRLYYPTLSLVCKSFGALLASPELYKTRSLLGQTEICLYVCIRCGSGRRWYTLCRKPDKTLDDTESKSSGYVLARVPVPDVTGPGPNFGGLVAVGSDIYQIDKFVSSVVDCRSHTRCEAPRFPVKLWASSACVVDEKIYVAGRYRDGDGDGDGASLVNLFKVLDPKTQIWDSLPPNPSTGNYNVYGTACIDGKLQVVTSSQVDLSYDSKEGRWDLLKSVTEKYCLARNSYCVVENVLYSASSHGNLRWYDYEVHEWKNLNGLDGLPKLDPFERIGLAGYGVGKMMVFWKQDIPSGLFGCVHYYTKIWCAVISLERRSESIWGQVEWSDHVLTSGMNFDIIKVLAVTL